MKVVILCGGQGSRLREHTEHMPKPMVPVGNRPILWHIMKHYAYYGFDEFVLCLGYKGSQIKEYFLHFDVLNRDFTIELGDRRKTKLHEATDTVSWKVTLVDTGDEALTGARLKRVEPFLDGDRFMLTYGDGVANVDLKQLLQFHQDHGRISTVTGVHPPARFGELLLEDRRVRAFSEKPQVKDSWINGGFFVFERAFLDYLEDNDRCDLEGAPLRRLALEGQLNAYIHEDFWQCMDTFRDWTYLNRIWDSGSAPWKIWGDE